MNVASVSHVSKGETQDENTSNRQLNTSQPQVVDENSILNKNRLSSGRSTLAIPQQMKPEQRYVANFVP